jgi:hypothetical protein
LEKTSKKLLLEWLPTAVPNVFWKEIAPTVLPEILPHKGMPIGVTQSDWVNKQLGIEGLVVKNGWFSFLNFPLEKYVDPFLFPDEKLHLSGKGEARGNFDQMGLVVRYDAKDLILENKDLSIDIKQIAKTPSTIGGERVLPGVHYVDFSTQMNWGQAPVFGGTYLEKNTGLFFTDIDALVVFEGKTVRLINTETFCQGVSLNGDIFVDYSDPRPDYLDVEIVSQGIQGRFSQVKQIFSHLQEPPFFIELPVDGDVAYRGKGGYLRFSFFPGDFLVDAKCEGTLAEGVVLCDNIDLCLKDFSLNFDYDHLERRLEFTDILGTVLVGKPTEIEEYTLSSDKVSFTDLEQDLSAFDLMIVDKNRELIRVAGTTSSHDEDGLIHFSFDRDLTHFGEAKPSDFQLVLKDWSQLEMMKLGIPFRLRDLLRDLQTLSRSGVLFLSPGLVQQLNRLKTADGEFMLDLEYDGMKSHLAFQATGQDVLWDTYPFKKVLLNGKRSGDTWMIDQLQLDDLSIAAELIKSKESWKANFLGVKYGQSLLLGLEGAFNEGDTAIQAKVNLLEVNLDKLDEWDALKPFVDEFGPKGKIKAFGDVRVNLTQDSKWNIETQMTAQTRNLEWNGLYFGNTDHIRCSYATERGLTIDQASTSLKDGPGGNDMAYIDIRQLTIGQGGGETHLQELEFHIPAEHLPWVATTLHHRFSESVTPTAVEVIQGLKKEGVVQGTCALTNLPGEKALHLRLADGTYTLFDQEHSLKNVQIDLDDEELKFSSRYRLNHHEFWISGRSSLSSNNNGVVVLSDTASEEVQPLTIYWSQTPDRGVVLEKLQGHFSGMNFNLREHPEDPTTPEFYHLHGTIQGYGWGAARLLPEVIGNKLIAWKVGKGYAIHGAFAIAKNSFTPTHPDEGRDIYFEGVLQGDHFELKGYQFDNLSSYVSFSPNQVYVSDLSVVDPALELHAEQLLFAKDETGQWRMNIPTVLIHELRPSALQEMHQMRPRTVKTLLVEELYLQDIKGLLQDERSFTGYGSLKFVNPPKKNLGNFIFAIPGEILSRLGLNLSALTPVTGTIQFQLNNGHFTLTKFKDVYSDGKLSRFHLANSLHESYMDFDGNLFVEVRMKQYSILLKLAEMFTVTVHGTIDKPKYTLQKQRGRGRSAPQTYELTTEE